MAFKIPNPSKQDQRAVIQFLSAEGCQPAEVFRRMKDVYGDACVSKTTVVDWARMFRKGREQTTDYPRPGQAHVVATEDTREKVNAAIAADRRINIQSIANGLNMSYGTAHKIVKDLGYHKVCAQWIPRVLTEDQKLERMGCAIEHLSRYHLEGNDFLLRIVAEDETWCHHFEPSSKASSMQWKHPSSPRPKKFKTQPSAGKVMVSVFFDCHGPLLLDFKEPGQSINAARYCQTLTQLRRAIKNKRPGLLTAGVIVLHDNARPHVANQVQDLFQRFKWEMLRHPPYSPDLSPCDFHIFGPLKKALKGQRFQSDAEVQDAVRDWFDSQPSKFYMDGICKLVTQWDKCLNAHGDFF